jgi:predicted GNAT family acetyltransferase
MPWTLTQDLDEYLRATREFLEREPAGNTLLLTVSAALRARGTHAFGERRPLLGWWHTAPGPVSGALLWTPPYPMILSACPAPAVEALTDLLLGLDEKPVEINAAAPDAEVISARLSDRTGITPAIHTRMRLYRLGHLTPPDPAPPGFARYAGDEDRELLMQWYLTFFAYIGEQPPDNLAEGIADQVAEGAIQLWCLADGTPVSMAGCSRTVADMTRIGPVLTPAGYRGRGYASAVTAAMSQAALDRGVGQVLLFTDLANGTSNALYQRLGYQPVTDRVAFVLVP